jgi:hypothetical protein
MVAEILDQVDQKTIYQKPEQDEPSKTQKSRREEKIGREIYPDEKVWPVDIGTRAGKPRCS